MTEKIIRQFKITTKYKGYFVAVEAIEYSINNFGQYIKITKDIYPTLSIKYHMSISSIERNIRTIIIACWNNNKILLEEIMGCKLTTYPSNSEFIFSIAYYIVKNT